MYVPGMICFTLVVSLLLAQTEGRAFNNVQSREKRQTSGCDGGQRYDNRGTFSTNIGGEYGNNENCCWDIVPDVQGPWTITFRFDTFDVESSSGCRYDALTFDTDDGPVKECGEKTDFSRTFTVTESQFQVCFSSDGSVTGQGVSGTYSIDTVNADTTSYPSYGTAYPDYATAYPEYTTAYPDYTTAYPNYATAYPYYATAYPDYATAYSDYATAYSDDATAYPDYATDYPAYATAYPEYTTAYPDYITAYPDYTTAYPAYATSYHDYTTAYPNYATDYPYYAPAYPDYATAYPVYATAYPDYATAYPYYATAYPDYATAYPDYATAYPDYATAYPDDATAYPDYATAYPDYATAYPDYATAYPNYATAYPYYATAYPDYATAYPHYPTAYPDYATAYPDYATAYHDCATAHPDYATAYPEYPDEPVVTSGNISYYGNHGSISVNADGNYENSQDVCYSLHPSFTGSGIITFVFNVFDIEEATSCVFDYIEFDDVNTKLRECGTVDAGTQREFEFHDGRFNVCFHSDGSVTGRGIQATYSMNPVREVESVETTPYPVDIIINSTMSTNFTEATTLPVREVESVETTPYPVDIIVNSTMSYNYTEATTLAVNTTVNTTSLPDTEDNTCTQVLTSDVGTLSSPGNGSYANNVQCVTVITGPSVPYTLVLSFTTFDLEDSSTCRYDYLEVDMGDGYSQKGCGSNWDNRTVEYTSDGGNVTVTFSSDSSQTGAGYSATYTIQPRGVPSLSNGDCRYINTNVTAGVIQSLPGTGSDYTNNMDCSYEFTRNTPFYLDINFIALDTESSSNCRYDYVQVGDDKYCGSDLPNATRVSVQGGAAVIRFRSDSSVTGKGFVALFNIEEHCNFDSEDLEGTYTLATDSNDHYKNNQHCDITLRSPPTPHITTVNFTRFDIEEDTACHYDSLTVTSDDGTEKLCGAKESFIRQYTGPTVDMTFTSDRSVVRTGFSFNYVTELVYCNATINATSGTFESEPGDYESNMYCTYTINTPTPGDLVFTFPLFDVESGRSCRYDAVEMEGDKLCGTNIQEKTYSTDGHFQFVFTSDGSVNGEGFKIDFTFIPHEIQN
ncbi:cubilin-like [Haliotis rufescens]|uniref:cubilin-like n=1 Tax=Haliotis rufescens TaxID=6454 RepID=UPI00201F11FA|nr:cubilin-like [Haliotis rufescens]